MPNKAIQKSKQWALCYTKSEMYGRVTKCCSTKSSRWQVFQTYVPFNWHQQQKFTTISQIVRPNWHRPRSEPQDIWWNFQALMTQTLGTALEIIIETVIKKGNNSWDESENRVGSGLSVPKGIAREINYLLLTQHPIAHIWCHQICLFVGICGFQAYSIVYSPGGEGNLGSLCQVASFIR